MHTVWRYTVLVRIRVLQRVVANYRLVCVLVCWYCHLKFTLTDNGISSSANCRLHIVDCCVKLEGTSKSGVGVAHV
jgi:hypothetical protein